MTFNQKIELAAILTGGSWSLLTVLLFATGRHQPAYAMLAIGTVITTSIAAVQVLGGASRDRLPGDYELAEDV
jgi:hypothetical protein